MFHTRTHIAKLVLSIISFGALFGCKAPFNKSEGVPSESSVTIQGMVVGGRQSISGAHVFVLAASEKGYGGRGIAASVSNASSSLLTDYPSGSFPTTLDGHSTSPTVGDYYVRTDANGNFSLTGEYSCTPGTEVYLYTVGGNAGSGVENSAAGLLALLGQCPQSGTMASIVPFVIVNEASTVAAAFALAGFASDALHVGSSGSALARNGIANAFSTATNLYSLPTGNVGLRSSTPAGNGVVPQTKLNALANSLAACVNSSGSTSSQCTALFEDATSDGTISGTQPTDTATAAINIAHFPDANVSAIFLLATGVGTPYQPTLSSPPSDWTVAVAYSGVGIPSPSGITIDSYGNVWILSSTSNVAKISPLGVVLTGSGGLAGSGLSDPRSIAIDASGYTWITSGTNSVTRFPSEDDDLSRASHFSLNPATSTGPIALDKFDNAWILTGGTNLVRVSSSGILLSGGNGYSIEGSTLAGSIAVDTSGNAWITTTSKVVELSPSGDVLSGTNGYTGGGLGFTCCILIDGGGNGWIGNAGSGVTKLSDTGVPLSTGNGYQAPDSCAFHLIGGVLPPSSGIALDGGGNIWASNVERNSITEISNSGVAISGASGYACGVLSNPRIIAIDGSGNIWVSSGGAITEIVGTAIPLVTPIAAGLVSNSLGARP